MTEEQWDACDKPLEMVKFLHEGGGLSPRKGRLCATACVRRIWPLLSHTRSRHAVELAERSVAEPSGEGDLCGASVRARQAFDDDLYAEREGAARDLRISPAASAAYAASSAVNACYHGPDQVVRHLVLVLEAASPTGLPSDPAEVTETSAQAAILRDIFGNPFRPLTPLSPSLLAWSDGLVVRLAEAAYQHRSLPSGHLDPDRLAVLADALEDAGCTDASLLEHLRGQKPHVRGCFAVDSVLGKG
jgi:hypothetical protein